MKIRNILNLFRADSKMGIFFGFLGSATLVAFEYFGYFADLQGIFAFVQSPVYLGIAVFGVVLAIAFIAAIIKYNKNKDVAEISYVTNKQNENINTLAYLHVEAFFKSIEFKNIVDKYLANIERYFDKLIKDVNEKVDNYVTIEVLRQFDRTGEDLNRQRAFMQRILIELSNTNEVENFVREQHSACLDEIKQKLEEWVENNKQIQYYYSLDTFSYKNKYNKKLFRIELDSVELEINDLRRHIKDVTLSDILFNQKTTKSLTVAGMVAFLGLSIENVDADDIADTVNTIAGDSVVTSEMVEHVLHDILEGIGITIGVAAPVIIIIKVCRFLYKHRDRTEELEQLRQDIKNIIKTHYENVSEKSKKRIQKDAVKYVKSLITRFKFNFEKAGTYKNNAKPYI